jgi:SAM-dependent methyltransferase
MNIFQSNQEKLVGIDISKVALKKTSKIGEVVLADVTHLPFRPSSFQSVCAFDVLEHVPNKARMMAEINITLKKGGKLFLSVPINFGSPKGDERQPYDEPLALTQLILLIKQKFNLSIIRGFWGKNPLNFSHTPKMLITYLPYFLKHFPYLLWGSTYVSLAAIKSS